MRKVFVYILWIILAVLGGYASAANTQNLIYDINKTVGQDSVDAAGVFVTHRIPDGYDYNQSVARQFNASVNGSYIALYNDRNWWGGNVNFGSFEFEDGHEIEINIASRREITSYEILPKTADFQVINTTSKGISLKINKADQNLTIIINHPRTGNVLHLFCNSIDHQAPNITTALDANNYCYDRTTKTYYFGPGYHDLSKNFGGSVTVGGVRNVYLAAGAVLNGTLSISSGTAQTRIYGRGMIMNTSGQLIEVGYSQGGTVEGIIAHGHRTGWQTTITASQNIHFKKVKIISTQYASSDGIDVVNSHDCTFDSCFVRASDDCVAIKGLIGEDPAQCAPNKNLYFDHMQLWNDCNNGFGLGAETHAPYENIQLLNSEILFSYDDPVHHEQLDERAALNICCLHGTWFKDILFENINVYHCERLIGLGFKDSFWFGSLPGDQSYEGGIQNVRFKNVRSWQDSGSSIANDIWMYGWHKDGTPDKFVENIWFDDVWITDRRVDNEQDVDIKTNNTPSLTLVQNLHFNESLSLQGDLNGDGVVDVADVNMVINMMLGKIAVTVQGDVTGDRKVDVADVNAVINIMLGKTKNIIHLNNNH